MSDEPKIDDPVQSKRFREMAREVDADENNAANFEKAVLKVATTSNNIQSPKKQRL